MRKQNDKLVATSLKELGRLLRKAGFELKEEKPQVVKRRRKRKQKDFNKI